MIIKIGHAPIVWPMQKLQWELIITIKNLALHLHSKFLTEITIPLVLILINLLKLLSRTNVKEILLDLVQMIAITSLPLFHKISYFSSLIIFKRVQIFLIVLKKKRKMKTMIRIKTISSVIEIRYSNYIESQTTNKRVRKRLI
jgi:hypothetical protein